MKIGFIGLGQMGSAMVRNLMKAGHSVTVYNRTRQRAAALTSEGAQVAEAARGAASGVEALITMLADDRAVEDVLFDGGDAISALPTGAVHISMSTISVSLSRRLTSAHREHHQPYVAAPLFGRPDAAAAAKLFVVAAGPADQIDRCSPLFGALAQKTSIVDRDPPAANLVTLAGNFLITTVIEGLAKAVSLVRKSGLDAHTFLDVLTNSLFNAPIYRNYGSMIVADTFEPVGFKMPLGLKDNRLLLAAAEDAAVPLPMASLVRDRFLAGLAQGMGDADWAAIARLSFRSAGL